MREVNDPCPRPAPSLPGLLVSAGPALPSERIHSARRANRPSEEKAYRFFRK
jgi:hypothetical protein